jgi:hypothetical protein
MARKNTKCRILRIVEYIGTSYSILFVGQDMILLLGNLRSLSTGCKRLRSFINGTPESLDRWGMLSEDLEPKGGILSRRWRIRKYLGIIEGCSGGVAVIVLRKGGDVGRCGGSGEMVAV